MLYGRPPFKAVIIGLGNPLLGDDSIGLRVAQALHERFKEFGLILSGALDIGLLEEIQGYDLCFVIDAVVDPKNLAQVLSYEKNCLGYKHIFSSHGIDLFSLLSLGNHLGYKMPEVVKIYGIGIGKEVHIGFELTKELGEGLDKIVEDISQDILGFLGQTSQIER